MNWDQLLSKRRLGKPEEGREDVTRTVFQKDFDRIVFSSAFRRLQDKTQVFPLAQNDYVRTRLTHSLEASCVGRSLGTMVGHELIQLDPALEQCFLPSEVGAIVATACLAHDIGNPPFGHAGEDAIAHWFRHDDAGRRVVSALGEGSPEALDLEQFEGNAQGFRVLTRLQHPEDDGGLQLSCATLAAFVKYPRGSAVAPSPDAGVRAKKHGFFEDDRTAFCEIADETGLVRYSPGQAYARHPLVFLVEAADDICYHVVDIEDGFQMKLLPFDEVRELFSAVTLDGVDEARLAMLRDNPQSQIEYLRAKAIGALVDQVVATFLANLNAIMSGTLAMDLTGTIDRATEFRRLKDVAMDRVYPTREVVLIEAAGFNVLGKLIEMFLTAINEKAQSPHGVSRKTRTLLKLFPPPTVSGRPVDPCELDLYRRVLAVTDFVSSMTDRYAVSLFKRLTGISLPGD